MPVVAEGVAVVLVVPFKSGNPGEPGVVGAPNPGSVGVVVGVVGVVVGVVGVVVGVVGVVVGVVGVVVGVVGVVVGAVGAPGVVGPVGSSGGEAVGDPGVVGSGGATGNAGVEGLTVVVTARDPPPATLPGAALQTRPPPEMAAADSNITIYFFAGVFIT